MNSKFCRLISETLKEYDKFITKHDNYTDTYSKDYLDQFVSVFRDWIMMQHCVEDREAMAQMDKAMNKKGRVVAEIQTTNGGETTIRRIYSDQLEQQIEVDERRAKNTLIDEVNSVIRGELDKSKEKVHVKIELPHLGGNTGLDSQNEVDDRRTAYEEGLDKHDIH